MNAVEPYDESSGEYRDFSLPKRALKSNVIGIDWFSNHITYLGLMHHD
jgi:hypothetical protein